MKKITFILGLFLITGVAFSQTTILNYDTVNHAWGFGNGLASADVANPDTGGINTTSMVKQLTVTSSNPFWASYFSSLNSVVDIPTNGTYVSFYLRSDRNDFPFVISFTDPAGDAGQIAAAENPSSGII